MAGTTESLSILIKAKDMYSGELNKMVKGFGKAGLAIAGVLAGVTVAIKKMADETAMAAEEAHNWSIITGVNIKELTRLGFAVTQLGGDTEDLYDVLKETNVKMKEASEGTGGLYDNLKHLKIKVTDVDGQLRDTGEVFEEIVSALSKMENAALKVAIADEIWSDAGTKLLPILMKDKKAIESLKNEADRLNITLSEETAKDAAEYNNSMRKMDGTLRALTITIGKTAIPAINKIAEEALEAAKAFNIFFAAVNGGKIDILNRDIKILSDELNHLKWQYDEFGKVNVRLQKYLGDEIELRKQKLKTLNDERDALMGLEAAKKKVAPEESDGDTGGTIKRAEWVSGRLLQIQTDLYVQQAEKKRNELAEIEAADKLKAEQAEKLNARLLQIQMDLYLKEQDAGYRALEEEKKREEERKTLRRGALSDTITILESLNTISDGKNREAFEALKIARVAETIVNTYAGATRALTLPYPFNIIAMTAVITAGLANLSVIQRTTFGGGGGGSVSASTPTASTPPAITTPTDTGVTNETTVAPNITIVVENTTGLEDWDQIAEDILIPAINTALDRNSATLNVKT